MTENIYSEESTYSGETDLIDATDDAIAEEVLAEAIETEVVESAENADSVEDVMVLDELDDPELVLPVWEPTGEPRVDAALDSLGLLEGAEVSEHALVFTEVHSGLRQVLADLDADRL